MWDDSMKTAAAGDENESVGILSLFAGMKRNGNWERELDKVNDANSAIIFLINHCSVRIVRVD